MKIQTFSIVTGTTTCNARCPYCVSRMTPTNGIDYTAGVNWRNFDKACQLAKISGVTTVLITGKGEPTLYSEQITKFLQHLREFDFPLVELQTNGILLGNETERYKPDLCNWWGLGLTLISVSVVHYQESRNNEIFQAHSYPSLVTLIEKLHNHKFSVRLSCTMIKGYIDNQEEISRMINFAKAEGVEQLSLRKLCKPVYTGNEEVYKWVEDHQLSEAELSEIVAALNCNGTKLMTLENQAVVYDVYGQNVCLTDALTLNPETDNLRQIIFFPDGHLRYDWQYPGAILL